MQQNSILNDEPPNSTDSRIHRRDFVTAIAKATGGAALLSSPLLSNANFSASASFTVGEVMDLFIKEVPGAPFANTVDTLKAGNRDIIITGIVTTMFATLEVIQKAINLSANFIIAHEPTFYNHVDETDWLQNDEVYMYKAALLKKNNIAVWRNHDYIHSLTDDGVRAGVLAQLGWGKYYNRAESDSILLPEIKLKALIYLLKEKLNITMVRYIGNPEQPCRKVALLPGSAGGKKQIEAIGKLKPDVLVCGEIAEWETAEYVRDARTKGEQISLVVLGHIASEEGGSEYMLQWLKSKVPGVLAAHIPSGNSLSFL